jgi:Xaa-Pro aminopeptidase
LREGDLVFIDVCFGVDGYHVDKTLMYSYKRTQPEHIEAAHSHCLELERKAASLLRTGAKPSDVYAEIAESVKPEFRGNFMGAPGRTVPFLGHSIGLYTDETPVLAKGFDAPLEPGMTFAVEPKMGFEGVGMVGSENTYLVTDDGGVCLTGSGMDIVII